MKTVAFRSIVWVLSVVCLGFNLAAQKQTTIRVPLPPSEEIAVVTFDPARIAVSDVKHWMQLAENARYSAPVVPIFDCGENRSVLNVRRAVAANRNLIAELDPRKYPPVLSGVVGYLRRLQSFRLWQLEQKLAFVQNGDTPGLQWEDINADEQCGSVAQRITNEGSGNACRLVFHDWTNCTINAIQARLGPYPKPDWEGFLHAYDLHVKIISTADD